MLAKTAGVKHLVILINKMDDPTVAWNEERCVLVEIIPHKILKEMYFWVIFLKV